MEEIINKLKDIMIEAAEKDGNYELAKKLKQLRKEEKEVKRLNRIKSGQEVQREQMRGHMGLTDTEGMTVTEENFKKLMADLMKSRPAKDSCDVYLDNVLYEDFRHFCSALLEKYFTKE